MGLSNPANLIKVFNCSNDCELQASARTRGHNDMPLSEPYRLCVHQQFQMFAETSRINGVTAQGSTTAWRAAAAPARQDIDTTLFSLLIGIGFVMLPTGALSNQQSFLSLMQLSRNGGMKTEGGRGCPAMSSPSAAPPEC